MKVLYVAAEGANGYPKRVDAWETGWQKTIPDEGALAIVSRPVNLGIVDDTAELIDLVREGGYGGVVLDTLARCTVGMEENSARDVGVAVDSMHRIREATPGGLGVVIGVHHAGKDGRTLRGSSAYEGGADTVYFVERDGIAIHLERQKRKDGPVVDNHTLRFAPIEGTESGVLENQSQGSETDASRMRAVRLFLSQVCLTSGTPGGQLQKMAEEAGFPRATYYRYLRKLQEVGAVVNVGTEGRPRYTVANDVEVDL